MVLVSPRVPLFSTLSGRENDGCSMDALNEPLQVRWSLNFVSLSALFGLPSGLCVALLLTEFAKL